MEIFTNNELISLKSIKENKYEPTITRMQKQKNFYPRSGFPLYKKYSVFGQKSYLNQNSALNYSLSNNRSHIDYHNNNRAINEYSNKTFNPKYRYINAPKNSNIENDLNVMKLQMSCNLVTHKINQIKKRVQNLHDSSIKDNINLINNNNIGINPYKQRTTNYQNYINTDTKYNLKKNKRHVFMDFSKLRNKKYLKISSEMSKEINNTFNNIDSDNYDDTFRTIDNLSKINIKTDIPSNRNLKLYHKNDFNYFLLNTQNIEKSVDSNNSKLKINSDMINKNNFSNLNCINNNENINDIKNSTINNDIIKSNNYKKINKINKFDKNLSNIILINSEKNNNISNKKIRLIKKNDKNNEKLEDNINTNTKNIFQAIPPKFDSLDKYFIINNSLTENNKKNIIEKNLYDNEYKYNTLNINENINKDKNKIQIYRKPKYINDNKIKIEENTTINNNNNKLLLYSNLESSNEGNLFLNKYYKDKVNIKNNYNYIKGQNNLDKRNELNIAKERNIYEIRSDNNKPTSYLYLKNENIKYSNNYNKNNNDKKDNNSKNNNKIQHNIIDMNNKSRENIKDNNFKININNISNYSIKNNCLNINNSTNKNNSYIDIEESNKKEIENMKLNHNYSKDDLLLNSEKVNLDYSENDESVEKENKSNLNTVNDIFKRKITFEKDEVILDPIMEENLENINKNKNNKEKNILKTINKSKNKDKKIKIKHKELCHKFTSNPQHFFTVKLNEMMLKALNINNKKIQQKK